MSFSWCSEFYIFFTLNFISIVQTVPPDYCLSPLNRSDCNGPPRPVFTYYKPGSRCEVDTWRGCPTLNKFENEYLCSLNCIFRMRLKEAVPTENPCDIPLNQEKCGETSSLVYTHVDGSCEPVLWSGCPSPNKFTTKSTCESVCQTTDKMLLKLDAGTLVKIDEILENVIEEEMPTPVPTEAVTEPATEPTPETDSVTEEETETETDIEPASESASASDENRPTVITDYNG